MWLIHPGAAAPVIVLISVLAVALGSGLALVRMPSAGVSAPPPCGGCQRTIAVRVNPDPLRAHHLPPEGVDEVVASG